MSKALKKETMRSGVKMVSAALAPCDNSALRIARQCCRRALRVAPVALYYLLPPASD